MAFHAETHRRASDRSRRDGWEFRVAFALTFLVMLVPTALSRLSFSYWSVRRGDVHRSIFHEARARTDQIVPFMFMG